jgi:membrane protein YqaA with SNARE-associated domain
MTDVVRAQRSLLFVAVFGAAFLLSLLYQNDIVAVGNHLLARFSTGGLYVVLFLLAAVSSTLLPLPVWIYAFTSVALGFDYVACGVVIGLGSSLGSASTYCLGRYCRRSRFLQRQLDEATLQKWQARSASYCGATMFFGTVSPVPMDALYAVAGVLRFPAVAFLVLVTAARVIRYEAMAFLFFALR